jgi:hypothetical protein
MGHKGVSKRKLPKEKEKTIATANRGTGLIAGLNKSEGGMKQPPGKSQGMPFGQGGINPSAGTKKDHKNH